MVQQKPKNNNPDNLPKLDLGQGGLGSIKDLMYNNLQNELLQCCSHEYIQMQNTVVVNVNLERCTLDNVSTFKNYIGANNIDSYPKIILDFSKAIFMDSTFLGSVIMLLKKIKSKNGKLKLIIDFDKIKILSPFQQLKTIVETYSSIDEAMNH